MADYKAQPKINFTTMSSKDFQNLLSGGNLSKPLYEFDANGNAVFHEENVPYYTPNVVLTNPFNGRSETATGILDYVKNEEEHRKAVQQTYDSLAKYNHEYNVDSMALGAVKSLAELPLQAGLTAAETVGNIVNAVHSTGRTVMEAHWKAITMNASNASKFEMSKILEELGPDLGVAYVKNHDFDNDLTLSDETKKLFKNYKALLAARDNDNLWSNVIGQTLQGTGETLDKTFNPQTGGNKYQNLEKFSKLVADVAGSWGVFKGAGYAAKAMTASKVGAAITKTFGITGKSAVYGTAFLNQYDSLRRQGLASGLSYDEAAQLAFVGASFEAWVEGWGVAKYGRLEAKKSLMNVVKAEIIPEAVEEMAQTGGENIFTKLYGINTNSFRDIVEEIIISGLGGAIGGGASGGFEYLSGQVTTRVQAVNDVRRKREREATEKAKANPENIKYLEYKKNQIEKAKAEEVVTEGQEVTTEPQLLTYNEQRLLLEHDESYRKEIEAAQEEFRKGLSEIFTEKLKKANPNVTEKQIENANALLYRVSNRLENNDTYAAALSSWADDIVKWSNEKAPQYAKNLEELDKRFGLETLGLSPEDIADFKSNDRATRHNAEWKAVKLNIKSDLMQAGVDEKYTQKMADTFEGTFASSAFLSNVSPLGVYNKLAPKIVGLSRASINKQYIPGYEGVLDNMPNSSKDLGATQRIEAEQLLQSLADDSNNDNSENNKQVALDELFRGMDTKQNVTPDDVLNAVTQRARMEQALASEMGVSYGQDLDFNDYKTIALMRARGATQEQINDAYGVTGRADADTEFEEARQKLFPKLTSEELKQATKLVARINADRPGSNVEAAFVPTDKDVIASQANTSPMEETRVGGEILLGADVSSEVAAEEFMHSITTKLEEAAKIQAIKDSGKRLFAAYDIYSVGLFPETRPLARLFDYISRPLNGMELTDREKHETLATAFVNHVKMDIVPQVEKEALNHADAERNDLIATAEDSKYNNLSAEQKKALGERFMNLLKPEAGAELIQMGNQIANAGADFDVLAARNMALEALAKYEVYNDALWANLLANMESMTPEQQLSLLQGFGTNLVQQGYDSLVADTYNVEFDEKERQVLVRKAYQEGSLLAEDEPTTIYYHSTPAVPSKNVTMYNEQESWWDKTKAFAKKTFDPTPFISEYIETLSHAAFKADPIIGSTLRRAMYKYGEREIAFQKLAAKIPLLMDKFKMDYSKDELKRKQFVDNFKNVLLAGNYKAREKAKAWLVKQFAGTGAEEEVAKTMDDIYTALDDCRDNLIAKGVPVGYVKEYWPSYVKDRDGLAKYFGYNAPITQTEKNIKALVEKLKKEFPRKTLEEINTLAIDSINKQWHKYEMGEDVSYFHQRGNYFTADTSGFYDDPFETLARYFENVNRTLLMRELTGRVIPSAEEADTYSTNLDRALLTYKNKKTTAVFKDSDTGKLGKAFALALSKKNKDMRALDNFAKKMKMFVNKVGTNENEFAKFWERTNSFLLGNIVSTLNQGNELSVILSNFGLEVTNDAIKEAVDEMLQEIEANPDTANLESINVQPLQELLRYKDNDMLAKLTEISHTLSGFAGADILLKNIEIKACLKGAQAVLKSGNVNDIKFKRFMRLFDQTFPNDVYSDATRAAIFEDIKAGNLTDNVKFFLFNYLSNVQPINMAEVPTGFLTAGSVGRLVYQYHTTQLRQLEYVGDDIKWGFKTLPLKDAIKNLLGYMLYFMAIGVPIALLQDLVRGRKPNVTETAVYSPFQLLSINEYTINSIREKGLFGGIIEELSPSFRIGDDVSKDAIRMLTFKDYQGNTVKDVPIFGPLAYYWMLGGRDRAIRQGEALFHSPDYDEKRANALKVIGG